MTNYGSMGSASEDPAQRMKDQAQNATADALDQAKQKAGETVEQARETTLAMMDQQKGRAAEGLGGIASALRQTGEQLRNSEQGAFGQYADKVAEKVDAVAGQLRDKDMDELLLEAERFARREPEMFLGGAVLLGLLAARFMKSSNARRQQLRYSQGSSYTASVAGAGSYPASGQNTGATGQYGARSYGSGYGQASTGYGRTGYSGTSGGYGATGSQGSQGFVEGGTGFGESGSFRQTGSSFGQGSESGYAAGDAGRARRAGDTGGLVDDQDETSTR